MPRRQKMNKEEFTDTTVRKFITKLFTQRANTLLDKMASLYNWTNEQKTEYKNRFILERMNNFIPEWQTIVPEIEE
jgi:predicted secreted protein